jgi:hypothetical protein
MGYQNPFRNKIKICTMHAIIENLRDSYENILLECKELCSIGELFLIFNVKRSRLALQYFDEIDGDLHLNIT